MAREILKPAATATLHTLTFVCALLSFGGSAEAQRADHRGCVTRFEHGRPYVVCKQKSKALKSNEERRTATPPKTSTITAPRRGLAAPRRDITVAPARAGAAAGTPPPTTTHPTPLAPCCSGAAPVRAPAAATAAPAAGPRLRPVRALIEPSEMPPRDVAGYGIVAFTTRPVSQDIERYKYVCEAYKATLISQKELPSNVPPAEQMITFWPILNKNTPEAVRTDCQHLVNNYALRLGFDAIQDADRQHEGFASRRGPFLIAWAPSESRYQPDALVLVMDLSSFESQRSFVEVFQDWRQQIVDNPHLWRRGFDVTSVRRIIRDTFDRYGDGLMRLIKTGS